MIALLIILAAVLAIGMGLPVGWLIRPVRAQARRFRPAAPPAPVGLPIERVAANLRRLDGDLRRYAAAGPLPGKHCRVTAARQAYEDLLVQACSALDVQQRLRLPGLTGPDRSLEMLRVEAALAAAGLRVAA